MSRLRFFSSSLSTQPSPQRQQVMEMLEAFCNEVEQVTQQRVSCALTAGFTTGFGQEYRVQAHSQAKNIDHILFRAYVPVDGLPMRLDLYEDQMTVCNTPAEVSNALAAFAQRDAIRETLKLLSQ